MPVKKSKDPVRAAALIKASFERSGQMVHPQFQALFQGVLRDHGVTEAQVDAWLASHADEAAKATRGED